jgi:hypothetical protein
VPPVTFLSIVVLSQIMQQMITPLFFSREKPNRGKIMFLSLCSYAFFCAVFTVSLSITLLASYQWRIRQRVFDDGARKQVGLWLRENAASAKDTVFLEPLGYIGFFSQLKMYDFPGLSSPEVVAARKTLKSDDYAQLIVALYPDWLVLRPFEIASIQNKMPALLTENYQAVKVFDISEKLQPYLKNRLGRKVSVFPSKSFTIFKLKKRYAPSVGRS